MTKDYAWYRREEDKALLYGILLSSADILAIERKALANFLSLGTTVINDQIFAPGVVDKNPYSGEKGEAWYEGYLAGVAITKARTEIQKEGVDV